MDNNRTICRYHAILHNHNTLACGTHVYDLSAFGFPSQVSPVSMVAMSSQAGSVVIYVVVISSGNYDFHSVESCNVNVAGVDFL